MPYPNTDDTATSSNAVNKAVHVQAASRKNDNSLENTLIISGVSFLIAVVAYFYAEWNWQFTTSSNVDEMIGIIAVAALWPWARLALHSNRSLGRAVRRAELLVETLESALDVDLNRNGIVGPGYPEHWLADYTGHLITDTQLSTTREDAISNGLTQPQWEAARDTLIQVGIAIPVKYSNNRRGFRLKKLTISELNIRMPNDPPQVHEPRRPDERGNMATRRLRSLAGLSLDDWDDVEEIENDDDEDDDWI